MCMHVGVCVYVCVSVCVGGGDCVVVYCRCMHCCCWSFLLCNVLHNVGYGSILCASLCRCGHCKNLAPHWAAAAMELKGKVKLGALDATVHTVTASKYQVGGGERREERRREGTGAGGWGREEKEEGRRKEGEREGKEERRGERRRS